MHCKGMKYIKVKMSLLSLAIYLVTLSKCKIFCINNIDFNNTINRNKIQCFWILGE